MWPHVRDQAEKGEKESETARQERLTTNGPTSLKFREGCQMPAKQVPSRSYSNDILTSRFFFWASRQTIVCFRRRQPPTTSLAFNLSSSPPDLGKHCSTLFWSGLLLGATSWLVHRLAATNGKMLETGTRGCPGAGASGLLRTIDTPDRSPPPNLIFLSRREPRASSAHLPLQGLAQDEKSFFLVRTTMASLQREN